MAKPEMSSGHACELKISTNSNVRFVDKPATGRGLYMISVITRGVLRLEGPGGSRSRVNCASTGPPARSMKSGRNKRRASEPDRAVMHFIIDDRLWKWGIS